MSKLVDNPYIYFNSNPLSNFLIKNYSHIKAEFYGLLKGEFNYVPDQPVADKPNAEVEGYSGTHSLYKGLFNSVPLYIRREIIDEYEAVGWQEDVKEKVYERRIQNLGYLKYFINEFKPVIGGVTFNISFPGSNLSHHFGVNSDYLRLHMCIKEDPGCFFDIENWKHCWKEGELFGFDDAWVLHGTRHFTSLAKGTRIIMLIDVKKNYLRPYAKNWPCRTEAPTKFDMPRLDGWTENGVHEGLNLFVKDWPKHIGKNYYKNATDN